MSYTVSRKKKLFFNITSAFFNQIITLVCGLILPRLIIEHYGSSANGLLSSITHFLGFFSMMELGIGAVIRANLYKPLAENDSERISKILISAKNFFTKIGIWLCLYTACLMIYFPIAVDHSNGYISTTILVGSVAFSLLANYLFGAIYFLLLDADQKSYVVSMTNAIAMLLNTLFGIILIKLNANIETVKFLAALVLLVRSLILGVYVRNHYKIDLKLELFDEPIKQKWNGVAQHVALYILHHIDIMVLTVFSTLENVSIYYVYNLVVKGILQLVEMMMTGATSLFGNMYAQNERNKLNLTFSLYEVFIHIIVSVIFGISLIMLLPFIRVYTKYISDTNYIIPSFSTLMVIAYAFYCYRLPYLTMVLAAGHFKETQNSSIIEAVINVALSVLLVKNFGLIGVSLGTLIAMMYRTVYLAKYLSTHIIYRDFRNFITHTIVDIVTLSIAFISGKFFNLQIYTLGKWIFVTLCVSLIILLETVIINFFAYKNDFKMILKLLKNRIT